MIQTPDNNLLPPEATPESRREYFTIPTLNQILQLNGHAPIKECFGYSEDPTNRIYARTSLPNGFQFQQEEIPFLHEELAQAFIEAEPHKMLIYRLTPEGPAVAFIPEPARESLKDKIVGIERYSTMHAGRTLQFALSLYNGDYGKVGHYFDQGHHLYKATAQLLDGMGEIAQNAHYVNPKEDVLYINWFGGEQTRIQTEILGPEQGKAYYFLAHNPLINLRDPADLAGG